MERLPLQVYPRRFFKTRLIPRLDQDSSPSEDEAGEVLAPVLRTLSQGPPKAPPERGLFSARRVKTASSLPSAASTFIWRTEAFESASSSLNCTSSNLALPRSKSSERPCTTETTRSDKQSFRSARRFQEKSTLPSMSTATHSAKERSRVRLVTPPLLVDRSLVYRTGAWMYKIRA